MVDIPYVCLYSSYLKTLEPFNDAQRGRILTAMLDYAVNGSEPKFSGSERFIWPTIKERIDRDIAAYIAKIEKNRANGAKGGRPKKQSDEPENPKENEEPENPKNPPVFSETQKSQGEEKGEGEGKGKGDISNLCASDDAPNPPPSLPKQPKASMAEVNELFELLWKKYPEKKGKGQVSEAKRRALFNIGLEEMERAIDRYLQELKKDADWRKPQNGSTFFNSGYVDYLDANYEPTEKGGHINGQNARNSEPVRQYGQHV